MRIAVYDKYWPTAGGGEKFAGGVAQVLVDDHEVTLLAHEPVDTDRLGERLALDLSKASVEEIGEAGRLERASAAHDLLINLSFSSSDRNGAPHGIYVVHFPHDPWTVLPPRQQDLLKRFGPLLGARHPTYEPGEGFFAPDMLRASKVWWSDGDGEILVPLAARRRRTIHLLFARLFPPGVSVDAAIEVDGRLVATRTLGAATSRHHHILPVVVAVPAVGHTDGTPVRVRVRSDTWSPGAVSGTDDHRELGVALIGAAVGNHPLGWGRAFASLFEAYPPAVGFLDTYDRILSNSAFTQRWVREYWDRDSGILFPPVTLRTPPELTGEHTGVTDESSPFVGKRPIIASIGRFFAADRGHSKKQIEMVQAFRALARSSSARQAIAEEGWELHLVGGCSEADRSYLDAVRDAARDLPVVLHVDASGAEVDRLYREASIYWHAAGLGEDAAAHPDRMEHFGITTVEAMSAGAVPVAFGAAGPLEAFDDGVEGIHFHNVAELAEATARLITNPEQRIRMSRAAVTRAESFGIDAFATRVRAEVDAVIRRPARRV